MSSSNKNQQDMEKFCLSVAKETCEAARRNGVDINTMTHPIRQLVPVNRFPLRDWVDYEVLLVHSLRELAKQYQPKQIRAFARGILRRQ